MFCVPVFFLILVFFSLSNFVIPSVSKINNKNVIMFQVRFGQHCLESGPSTVSNIYIASELCRPRHVISCRTMTYLLTPQSSPA